MHNLLVFLLTDSDNSLKKLAEFHAQKWRSPSVHNGWDVAAYWTEEKEVKKFNIDVAWEETVKHFPELQLQKRYGDLGKRLEEIYPQVFPQQKIALKKRRTVCHGDYKISNIFLNRPKPTLKESNDFDVYPIKSTAVYAIDWQWYGSGNPCIDVVSFINTSLDIGVFPSVESLLKTYHDTLTLDFKVPNYSYETFKSDYNLFLLDFAVFCIVGKWMKMTKKDFEKYERRLKDGLHLRRASHILFILDQVHTIVQNWNKTL